MNKLQIAPEDENIKEVENLLIQLNIIIKSFGLYPSNHPLLSQSLAKFHTLLQHRLSKEGPLRIDITKDKLILKSVEFGKGNKIFQKLAFFFYSRRLGEISFNPGTSLQEITSFLTVINLNQDVLQKKGGLKSLLQEKDISNIRVREFSPKAVDAEVAHLAEMPLPGDLTENELTILHKLLEMAPLENEDAQKIFRRLRQKPTEIAQFLKDLSRFASLRDEGEGMRDKFLYKIIKKMGEMVLGVLPDERAYLLRNLSEAQLLLDQPTKSELIGKLLENIEQDNVADKLIGQFSNIELADLLVESLPYTHLSWKQIASTLQGLIQNQSHREEILPLLINKLPENETAIANLIPLLKTSKTKPKSLPVTKREESLPLDPSKIASKVSQYSKEERHELEVMVLSVNDQTTKTEVADTLIELSFLEERLEAFSTIAELLKTMLFSFLMEKEYASASKILKALREQSNIDNFSDEHKEKIKTILEDVGNTESIRQLIDSIEAGTEVNQIFHCFHLIGELGIVPLLEILAQENNMARRKMICSILSDIGKDDLDALGNKISDKRWYLVRNVVTILGKIQDPEAMKYLRETARHPDHRVRNETVRALAAIKNQEAIALLTQLLNDKDLHIRQAAAEWLGIIKAGEAVNPLIEILQKRDPFCRNLIIKKAAIESLSQIGIREAVPVLEKLANKRAFFYRAKKAEIRNAAKKALQEIA